LQAGRKRFLAVAGSIGEPINSNRSGRNCINLSVVLLTGWKEIAAHLRCGVRTVQRWERFGLPIARPTCAAGQKRGLVIADSEKLDAWIHHRSAHAARSEVAANIERARSLQQKLGNQVRVMLRTELSIGMTHIQIARASKNRNKASRNTDIARRAYETIIHLSQHMPQSGEFTAELGNLKAALVELGEKA